MLHNAAILMRTIWTYQYDRIILYNKSYNNNTFRTISGGLYMVIGFVGLGIMGKPMAKNLCRAGYTLIVNDHHKENVDELVQAGARSGDLKQIGTESDVVITMLPNSPQVKDVMLGENGIAGYMKKGTCFIDMSSINPVDSRYIGDVLKEKVYENCSYHRCNQRNWRGLCTPLCKRWLRFDHYG